MLNVKYALIAATAIFLAGCGATPREIDLTTPTPTTESLHCSSDDRPLITEQVTYKGMLAGQTTFDEVKVLFGEPTDNIGLTYWFENEDPVFWITFQNETIDEIEMLGDFSLEDLIATYGCPDIFTHTEPDSFGGVHDIYLVYLDAGVYYKYPGGLFSSGLDVDNIYYFPSMGAEDFFQRYPHLEREHPMTWDMLYVKRLD